MEWDDWAARVEGILAGIRTHERAEGSDDVETIYRMCRGTIWEGRQIAQGILEVSPEGDDQLSAIRGAAATLEQQLDILERDLNQLFEYRNDKELTARNAFQVQVDYLAVEAQAERLYSVMTHRFIGVSKKLGDFGRKARGGAAVGTSLVSGTIANFGHWAVGLLKQLGTNLLQLIAKLVTPKEWSISGQAGTNLMFFQGAVTLEVTFG